MIPLRQLAEKLMEDVVARRRSRGRVRGGFHECRTYGAPDFFAMVPSASALS
jgi:hypothetical protein